MKMTLTQTLLTLHADTAADLMVENPVSIREDATVPEAVRLFTKQCVSAAPVVDVAGRPVGVISRSDVLIHEHVKLDWAPRVDPRTPNEAGAAHQDATLVRELMTPAIFSVTPGTPASSVIEQLLALKVHRLYVIDETGVLVGVISPTDVLWHLHE